MDILKKYIGTCYEIRRANSHMAIRCAEFGIPAAIGCGEQRFDNLMNADKICINCEVGLIGPLH